MVLYFDVREEVVIEGIVNRVVSSRCDRVYKLKTRTSRVEGICDECGSSLVKRIDDTIETAKKRYRRYNEITFPLVVVSQCIE